MAEIQLLSKIYKTAHLYEVMFESVDKDNVRCLVCAELGKPQTVYSKRPDHQREHLVRHESKPSEKEAFLKVFNCKEPKSKRQKTKNDRQPIDQFIKFQRSYPEYSSLTTTPVFSDFLKSVGLVPPNENDLKKEVLNELVRRVKEGEYFVIQLEEFEMNHQKFLKVDLLFVNLKCEVEKFTIEVFSKDLIDDGKLLLKDFKELLDRFAITKKVVSVESRALGNFPKTIAKVFGKVPVRPIANQVINLFVDAQRAWCQSLEKFKQRFNQIIVKISGSATLKTAIQNQVELLTIPPTIENSTSLDEFLLALSWANENVLEAEIAFLQEARHLGAIKVFENQEEQTNVNHLKSDLKELNKLLKLIIQPDKKSTIVNYMKKLAETLGSIDLNKYKGETGNGIKAAFEKLNKDLIKLNKTACKENVLMWLSFLDLRYEYDEENEDGKLEREFKRLAREFTKEPDDQTEQAEQMEVEVRQPKQLKGNSEEFLYFKMDKTYSHKSNLAEIFANADFSNHRYPTMVKLFKMYSCRETFIPQFKFRVVDREADIKTQLFLHLNRHIDRSA